MMWAGWRTGMAWLVLGGLAWALETAPAHGQTGDIRRSLGGYGAASIASYYGSRSGPLVPYAGGHGGFIPYEGLEAQRSAASILIPRVIPPTPIGGAGMGGTPIGGFSRRQGPRIHQPLNFRGRFGTGGSSGLPRRYGPGFGYPFRQPTRFSSGGVGMGSM
jgi:hypothetical protein